MTKEEYSESLKDPRWKAKRLEILKRDGHKCTKCGAKRKLHVHHKVYSAEYPWESKNEELITLCKNCHELVHDIKSNDSVYKPKRENNEFFYFTDEALQEHFEIGSKKLYSKFINKLIQEGVVYKMTGLLNGKVQAFYIDGPRNSITSKMFEKEILTVFRQFEKEMTSL